MAWATSTVGDATSGADYAASVGALQLWEDAIDGLTPGDYKASIITDIVDDVLFSTFAVGVWNLWITGNLTGATKRKITSNGSYPLRFTDTDIDAVTVDDIDLDADSSGIYALYIEAGVDSLTLKRCQFRNGTNLGVYIHPSATLNILESENCIFRANGNGGVHSDYTASASTLNFHNCLFVGNTNDGNSTANNANITRNLYNCIGIGNGSADFEDHAATVTNLTSCVSEDSTATNANHTSTTDCVASIVSETDFVGYSSGLYALTGDDNALWGTAGSAANTPATDFTGQVRYNDNIGPYEYPIIGNAQKRLSAIMPMMPFRGPGVWAADTGFNVGSRQAASLLFSGVPALTYGWGVEAPRHRNAVEIEE